MLHQRNSGILLHLSSLPGPYGIGDLGEAAHDFVDFLSKASQKYWQFLPVCPGDLIYGCSPYMGVSSFGGNPLLISLDCLQEEGLLSSDDFADRPEFSEYFVDFAKVMSFKNVMLAKAYGRFEDQDSYEEFELFCQSDANWLDDYALFMTIRQQQGHCSWHQWPIELAERDEKTLTEFAKEFKREITYYKFEQYCFFKQWHKMREYATNKGVFLIGDIPIYVSYDSADVWANQQCFRLHKKTKLPTHVAGVPPDYFSVTGQRWGNPLYRWTNGKQKNKAVYEWWLKRFKQIAKIVDVVRIDHFRGFESYWEIPASEETAIKGCWRKGPGKHFFKDINIDPNQLVIIAEDLGIITPEVEKLRDDLGLPGMKILQFAFDSDYNNAYLPHNYTTTNCVVYSGTHDNNTTLGWFLGSDSSPESKKKAYRYANSRDDSQINWDFIRMAFSSIAATAIIPMQDVLGFGEDCRMNLPGSAEGNWHWRCAHRFFNYEVCLRLKAETEFYGRGSQCKNYRLSESEE